MKEQETEWISISDFMASIVAVLVIFVIASILQAENRQSQILSQDATKSQITDILKSFGAVSKNLTGKQNFLIIDTTKGEVIFPDSCFQSGDVCLLDNTAYIINQVKDSIKSLLYKHRNIIITIEGYADSTAVENEKKVTCGQNTFVYSDNVTLSLCRAQETRFLITLGWKDNTLAERITVAGYGSTKPLKNVKSIGENRRVIFKFIVNNK